MMIMRVFFFSFLILLTNPVLAQEGLTKRVQFEKGKSWATIEGNVVRGTRDTYLLNAREGQTMTVGISSLENNAVFQIYEPKKGKTLNGAGEMDEAKNWVGGLPETGDYKIVVGGTRGNATYSLVIKIN